VSKLMLPRHVAEEMKRARSQHEAVANSIQKSSMNILNSDDFVTRDQARAQLNELTDYITERRREDPEYTLPRPIGWRVSVLMLTIPETTQGGLVLVDDNREARALSSPQGIVLNLAEAAFRDPSRFTVDGLVKPWIAVGDRVLWKKYDVTMFQLGNGQRLGFMNDTQAYGVIDRGWETPV
jgi:co-chaperonin GroES (HSP10)